MGYSKMKDNEMNLVYKYYGNFTAKENYIFRQLVFVFKSHYLLFSKIAFINVCCSINKAMALFNFSSSFMSFMLAI